MRVPEYESIYICNITFLFGRNGEIEIQKNTIGELLETLTGLYPETGKSLYDENGNIRSFIRIFVDGEDRTDLAYHHEVLGDNSEVLLLPLIAGGAPEGSIISDDRRKAVSLDDSEIERFGKHLLLREIGVKGQKRIKAARVLVAGAGALGSPVMLGNVRLIPLLKPCVRSILM